MGHRETEILVPGSLCYGYFGGTLAFLAFSSLILASVLSGSSLALSTQPLQHKKTGWPLSMILTGTPIAPSGLSSSAQYFWTSASLRSSVLSFAKLAAIVLFSPAEVR